MAVEHNVVKMLLWAKNLGVSFEKTLTLGHQGFECSPSRFRRALRDFGFSNTQKEIGRCFHRPPMGQLFVDEFFHLLGAKEITTVDRSDFEGANLLHDLNERFPESQRGQYNFVFDGGTLEHIFNYPAALRNCLELIRPGGYFLTITPASNLMGHGFYQFSPELFFRVFSESNGFALSKIVLYNSSKTDATFYQVNDPAAAKGRNNLISSQPMYLAVLAQRVAIAPILAQPPMQSDYVAGWENHALSQVKSTLDDPRLTKRLRVALNPYLPYWLLNWKRTFVSAWNREPSTLNNRRHFQKLSHCQICCERHCPPNAGNKI